MTTALRLSNRFAPSANPYWFVLDQVASAQPQSPGSSTVTVPCVWASRKRGRTVVTAGEYMLFPRRSEIAGMSADEVNARRAASPLWFLEAADTRYGGTWRVRWDGCDLQTNPAFSPLSPEQQISTRAWLDRVLHSLPAVAGHRGPFYKSQLP